MVEINDDLLQRARNNDMRAFEELYRIYSGMVYRLACRILNRAEDAQEVTQQVFLAIHKNLGSFAGKSSLKTWIYRIAVNCSLNEIKRRKTNVEVSWDEGFDPADTHNALEERINAQDAKQKLDNLLEPLNEDQKVCLLLRVQDGLTYDEIADVLHINVNTVRSRLNRARMILVKEKKGML